MTQTATAPVRPDPQPATAALFDLLARSWQLPAAVAAVQLDAAGKAAAFALTDGRVALAPLDDPDSSISRLRMEFDSGRSTIRAREKPVAPPFLTPELSEGAPHLAASGRIGFIAASRDGRIHQLTPRGQMIAMAPAGDPVAAIASDGRGRLAIARPGRIDLHREEGMERLAGLLTPGTATGLAFTPDGRLAVQCDETLRLWSPGTEAEQHPLGGTGTPVLSPAGGWLGGSNGRDAFWALRLSDGRAARIGNFRAAPASIAFAPGDAAVFASGAFRLAGWSLATPPFDTEATGALRTGRSGLVLVERVATHPARDLVAFGTADGTVAIARSGLPDKMILRHADGAAVTALIWSACGLHLAIGTATGAAALVTLPTQMFK